MTEGIIDFIQNNPTADSGIESVYELTPKFMSKQTDQGVLDFIPSNPTSESNLPYSFTYDNFLKSIENTFQSQKDLTAEKIRQAEEHNKNYKWGTFEWDKLDWELIRNRINFKLKAQYILERLKRNGHLV